ncbi:hypothetical protein CROQUDRAFT_55131 [Cronartium quercuum f. sp. fusiforme G11]|uniref:SWIM-type domain-containing protein n=1 Tax=Cronartium quercuum f. sp. fusiforme G11 TaxID=708437 RepID=A0A9P6N8D4_9BASI|nr:hypothetical protein CROQUDRAFT_55131 [Cronartium quercuum f. sp. fusiforme G11]
MVIEDSQDIVVLDKDDSPKTLVEAQLMAPSSAEPSNSWFGSQIIASIMCLIKNDSQFMTSCKCIMFDLTLGPCTHMITVSKSFHLPLSIVAQSKSTLTLLQAPKVTCQFHNKWKLVTDCSCKMFQECGRPCFHMHNMCRTLGLELYVLAPDSDIGSIPNTQEISIDPQSHSLNKPSITASDIITLTQYNPCQETLTHTDFTCPLVKSTVASVKCMEKVLGSNGRVCLVNSVPPALVNKIHNSANELE